MSLAFLGLTLDLIGKVLVALSVFFVHTRVMKEQRIDKKVIATMKNEQNLALVGLVLIVIGYLLQIPSKL